jgi:hypothetical protein
LRIDKPIAGIEFMKDNLGDKCFVTSEVLEEDCLVCNAEVTDELSLKDIKKLHQCFGHVSSRKLGDLIKDAGKLTDDVREKLLFVKNNCRSCVMNQNSKPRPAVALPRASKFQDVVTMDLKSYSVGINNNILYLVDMFSRLTVGYTTQ